MLNQQRTLRGVAIGGVIAVLVYFGVTLTGTGPAMGTTVPNSHQQVPSVLDLYLEENARNLLEQYLKSGLDPNSTDALGNTLLHQAIVLSATYSNSYGVIKTLLDHGANPNFPNLDGTTPLHFAAMYRGSEAVVSALIEAGGNPLIATSQAGTPYEFALQLGNEGAVAAIEWSTPFRPPNRSELQSLGRMHKGVYQEKLNNMNSMLQQKAK